MAYESRTEQRWSEAANQILRVIAFKSLPIGTTKALKRTERGEFVRRLGFETSLILKVQGRYLFLKCGHSLLRCKDAGGWANADKEDCRYRLRGVRKFHAPTPGSR